MQLGSRPTGNEFRLRLTLDVRPEDRKILEAYPAQPLWPDFVVLAAGWVALELAGWQEPHIGDYIALFAERLLDAAVEVSTESSATEHLVSFADSPACLVLRRAEDRIRVAYRESPRRADLVAAHPSPRDFRTTIAGAVEDYVAQVLAVNPELVAQPDVANLRTGVLALVRAGESDRGQGPEAGQGL